MLVYLVEETKDLTTSVLSTSLFVIHNSECGRQNNMSELTGGKHINNPFLHILQRHIKARRNDTTFVDTADEFNNNLTAAVIVKHSEIADVPVLLHSLQELDDNLGAGAKKDLPLAALLGVTDRL